MPWSFGDGVLIGSGAAGTVLRSGAAAGDTPVELLNIHRPDAVVALHEAYRDSGARILVTNTFSANPLLLEAAGAVSLCRKINEAGVSLAKEAARGSCLVWASVGPLFLGLGHDDYGDDDLDRIYAGQCEGLTGADALVLETFVSPREARAALRAASSTGLPVILQVGHTGRGKNRRSAIDLLLAEAEAAGVAAIGANCQHPNDVLDSAAYLLRRSSLPVTASPNAGNPRIHRGLVTYEFPPGDFVTVAERLAAMGVSVIGGCCGTTPDHIRAISFLRGRLLAPRPAPMTAEPVTPAGGGSPRPAGANRVRDLIHSSGFLISVEIRADRNMDLASLCENAAGIAKSGADLFDVPDNPGATVGRDAAVLAARLQDVTGVPSICHRAAIQSNLLHHYSGLLGCRDLGLEGILAVTGDPPSMGPLGTWAQRVTDLKSSVELLRLIRALRGGTLINGDRVLDPPDFCAGAAIGQPTPAQIAWLRTKIEAGAEFVFSQPVFSADDAHRLLDGAAGLGARLFPGLLPLTNLRNAEFFASGRIPGIRIPPEVLAAFARYDTAEDQHRCGMEIAIRMADTIAAAARGIYLIMPFGKTSVQDAAAIVGHLQTGRGMGGNARENVPDPAGPSPAVPASRKDGGGEGVAPAMTLPPPPARKP